MKYGGRPVGAAPRAAASRAPGVCGSVQPGPAGEGCLLRGVRQLPVSGARPAAAGDLD